VSKQSDHHLGILERSFDDGMIGRRSVEWLREYIAQLEAGQEWEPIPDNTWIADANDDKEWLFYAKKMLSITERGRGSPSMTISLPGDVCLMRRRPQEEQP
jgi:hypothetical protein